MEPLSNEFWCALFLTLTPIIFSDILKNVRQWQIDRWTSNWKRFADIFFEAWFYTILPWAEVLLVASAGAEGIRIAFTRAPLWNFELFLLCALIVAFCSVFCFLLLRQQYISKKLIELIAGYSKR